MAQDKCPKKELDIVTESEVAFEDEKLLTNTPSSQMLPKVKDEVHCIDDLISQIVETFEKQNSSGENVKQSEKTQDLLKQLKKPSEVLTRIDKINVVNYLDEVHGKNSESCVAIESNQCETSPGSDLQYATNSNGHIKNNLRKEQKMTKSLHFQDSSQPLSGLGQSKSSKICEEKNENINDLTENDSLKYKTPHLEEMMSKEYKTIQKIEKYVNDLVKEVLEVFEKDIHCLQSPKKYKLHEPSEISKLINLSPIPLKTPQRIDETQSATWSQKESSVENLEQANLSSVRDSEQTNLSAVFDSEQTNLSAVFDLEQTKLSSISDLEQTNLSSLSDLEQTNLSAVFDLEQTNLSSISDLEQTNLSSVRDSEQTKLSAVCDLEQTNLSAVFDLEQTKLSSISDLEQTNLSSVSDLEQINLSSVSDLEHTNLSSVSVLEQTNLSSVSVLEQTNLSSVCGLEQTNLSSVCGLEQTDLSSVTDFEQTNQLSACDLGQTNLSTTSGLENTSLSSVCDLEQTNFSEVSYLEQTNISELSLKQENTSSANLEQINVSPDLLWQDSTPKELDETTVPLVSSEKANTSVHNLEHTFMSTDSLEHENTLINNSQPSNHTIGNKMAGNQTEVSEAKEAAGYIKNIVHILMSPKLSSKGILHDIQIITYFIDIIGFLNEQLRFGIITIFLEQRELNRTTSCVHENFVLLEFKRLSNVDMDGIDVHVFGKGLLQDLKNLKIKTSLLFREYNFFRLKFLQNSLKFSSIPFELLIGDVKNSWIVSLAKSAAEKICEEFKTKDELEDMRKMIVAERQKLLGYAEEFHEYIATLDQFPEEEIRN